MLHYADHPKHAQAFIAAALDAADPAAALSFVWNLPRDGDIVMLAVGKAARAMALEALPRCAERLEKAIVTLPADQADRSAFQRWPVTVFPCDHPLPTPRNVEAARAVRDLVLGVRPDQHLLVLLSGGGSTHLCLPAGDIPLDMVVALTKAMQRAGATIIELNTVRKHCEQLKGGLLAAMCPAKSVRAFILSDVMGDRLDVIASGPTVGDPTTYADALAILERYQLLETAPDITAHLKRGSEGALPETPKPGDPALARVTNTILAGNRKVVDAVVAQARAMGFSIHGAQQLIEGEAAIVGRQLAARAPGMVAHQPACYVLGGETTVNVGDEPGLGGPSQEMALAFAHAASEHHLTRTALLTFSTDGRDGPTDAAGAIVSSDTPAQARRDAVDLQDALEHHDSHMALGRLGALIRRPATGTNLNHVAVLMVYPS